MAALSPQDGPKTLDSLRRWLRAAPAGTSLDAAVLARMLDAMADGEPTPEPPVQRLELAALPWSVLLWSVPPETRLSKAELLDALGRSQHWLYRHTHTKAMDRIPCRKFYGELQFVAGEIRVWLAEREELVCPGSVEAPRRPGPRFLSLERGAW